MESARLSSSAWAVMSTFVAVLLAKKYVAMTMALIKMYFKKVTQYLGNA